METNRSFWCLNSATQNWWVFKWNSLEFGARISYVDYPKSCHQFKQLLTDNYDYGLCHCVQWDPMSQRAKNFEK